MPITFNLLLDAEKLKRVDIVRKWIVLLAVFASAAVCLSASAEAGPRGGGAAAHGTA